MKWQNKGHEFDQVYNSIKEKTKYYLFGAGEYGQVIYNLFNKEIHIEGFIDNNKGKQNKIYNDKKVLALEALDNNAEDIGIIITISPNTRLPIVKQLFEKGYVLNKNVFTMETFMSVYQVYENNKVYFPSVSFLPSTRCNLNCECCLNFTPYMKDFDEREWEKIIEDVDTFFKCVDYIMLFHISGGEPLLYPRIGELVEYISTHYGHKIYCLRTVTNGTIVPSDELLHKLSQYKLDITVDDYRQAVPSSSEKFDRLLRKLESFNIPYHINKAEQWIDLAPFKTDHYKWSEEQLCRHFDSCHVPWQELRNKKLYSCNYASYAIVAEIIEETEEEVYDLSKFNEEHKKELVEFRMGYNPKGYVEFCKRCSGYMDVNPNIVEPAKQKIRSKSSGN